MFQSKTVLSKTLYPMTKSPVPSCYHHHHSGFCILLVMLYIIFVPKAPLKWYLKLLKISKKSCVLLTESLEKKTFQWHQLDYKFTISWKCLLVLPLLSWFFFSDFHWKLDHRPTFWATHHQAGLHLFFGIT